MFRTLYPSTVCSSSHTHIKNFLLPALLELTQKKNIYHPETEDEHTVDCFKHVTIKNCILKVNKDFIKFINARNEILKNLTHTHTFIQL